MTTTTVLTALLARLDILGSLPVGWPGVPMKPPSTGMWLETKFFPSEPRDLTWGNDSQQSTFGFFQVSVYWRPSENSLMDASRVADTVIDQFAKGTLVDTLRVVKTPHQSPSIDEKGKSFIPVTIHYQGIVSIPGYSDPLVVGGGATTDILSDLLARLDALTLTPTLPVAWPGIHKAPPSNGMWLETRFLPGIPRDLVWGNNTQKETTGSLMVYVCYRPGSNTGQHNQLDASTVAELILNHYPKGLGVGAVRISKAPWQRPAVDMEGYSYIPLTIPYLGIVSVDSVLDTTNFVVDGGINVVHNGIQVTST